MLSKEYIFDEVTHTHTIGGVVVPGITTLLKPLYNFSNVPANILSASCAFGSAVHKTIELYCTDCLDIDALDQPLVAPLNGFKLFLKEHKFNRDDFICEVSMCDPSLMVACIPDLILDGSHIIEIKTRKPNHLTDSIQTVCQEHIWKKNGGIRTKEYDRRVLYLDCDGSYTYTKVNDKNANSRFRLLLDHYWNTQTIQSWRNIK
jgi:hypothetical protein